jgi:hypothetical protein
LRGGFREFLDPIQCQLIAITRDLAIAFLGYTSDAFQTQWASATHCSNVRPQRLRLSLLPWVELDPTNGIYGSHDLIRVAVVRDPRRAVAVSSTWTGFPSNSLGMTVEVEVTAATDPNARKPPLRGSFAA